MINLVSCCFLDEKLYFTEQFSLLTYSVSALLFCCKLDNFSNIKFKCMYPGVSVRAGFAMVAIIMTLATFVGNKRKTEPKQLPSF